MIATDFREINNVIFDLGGVVIDLDRDRSVACLENLGLSSAGRLLDPYVQRGPFLLLETGKITAAQFFDTIREEIFRASGRRVSDTDIQDAFNAFLVDLPKERLVALRRLREAGYRVLAISNTNPVMFHSWIDRHFRAESRSFFDYFDGAVLSFEEGCCKPDRAIFDIIAGRYALDRGRSLLLDDSPANVAAARAAGFKALHVVPSENTDMLAITEALLKCRPE